MPAFIKSNLEHWIHPHCVLWRTKEHLEEIWNMITHSAVVHVSYWQRSSTSWWAAQIPNVYEWRGNGSPPVFIYEDPLIQPFCFITAALSGSRSVVIFLFCGLNWVFLEFYYILDIKQYFICTTSLKTSFLCFIHMHGFNTPIAYWTDPKLLKFKKFSFESLLYSNFLPAFPCHDEMRLLFCWSDETLKLFFHAVMKVSEWVG